MTKDDQFIKDLVADFKKNAHAEYDDESPSEDKPQPKGIAKKYRGRVSKSVTEERRRQVWRFQQQGLPPSDIAVLLGVNIKTVQKDIQANDKNLKGTLGNFDKAHFIGDTLRLYEELEQQAHQEFDACEEGSRERAAALKQIKEFRKARIELLQELGVVRKKGSAAGAGNTVNILSLQNWGEDTRQEVAKIILNKELEELPEPELDPNFLIESKEDE